MRGFPYHGEEFLSLSGRDRVLVDARDWRSGFRPIPGTFPDAPLCLQGLTIS
jgi:hypothetical protein